MKKSVAADHAEIVIFVFLARFKLLIAPFISVSRKPTVNMSPILNTPVNCIKPLLMGERISIN
jgi:hypothetical protein